MIRLCNITYSKMTGTRKTCLFSNISCEFRPHCHTAVLIKSGEVRSSLIRIIAGASAPDSGYCQIQGMVSLPPSWHGVFTPVLTGVENISFVSRLYGYSTAETLAFVKEFSGLDKELRYKFADLSGEDKAKITFLTILAIPFDYYIFEGDIKMGTDAFKKTCEQLVMARMETSSIVLVTGNAAFASRFHDFYVLNDEGMRFFPDCAQAEKHYKATLKP